MYGAFKGTKKVILRFDPLQTYKFKNCLLPYARTFQESCKKLTEKNGQIYQC